MKTKTFTNNVSKLLVVGLLSSTSLFAHSMWLNSFESKAKEGKRVSFGIGWGNQGPIDDALKTDFKMKSYVLQSPSEEIIDLKGPEKKPEKIFSSRVLSIVPSNLAMHKLSLTKRSEVGTYAVGFETNPSVFTVYINKKGKESKSIKPADKIRDLKELIGVTKTSRHVKTYFTFKEFTPVKPLGYDLEILPVGDFSKLREGDVLNLKVLYKGEPLKSGFLTAKNSHEQKSNPFYLRVKNGKAKLYLNDHGQWIFKAQHAEKIDSITHQYKASSSLTIKQ